MNPSQDLAGIIQSLKQAQNVRENSEELHRRFYKQVYLFFARNQKISAEDAQDLTQNTFFSVFRNLQTLRQAEQFESWLFQIARRELYHLLERQQAQKRKGLAVPLEDTGDPESAEHASPSTRLRASVPDPQERLLEKERLHELQVALQHLPEQMRRCLELRVYGELQYQEIAQALGISINTVKSHLFAAREHLRKALGPYFNEIEF